MKKLMLFVAIVCIAFAASAQENPVKFGFKVGATFSKFAFSEPVSNDLKRNLLFYAGFTADIPVGGLVSVQTGLTANGKGFKFEQSSTVVIDDYDNSIQIPANGTLKTLMLYAEVPLNLMVNLPVGSNKIFLGAGPYLGVAFYGQERYKIVYTQDGSTHSDSDSDDLDFGKNGDYRRIDAGLNFLAGFQLRSGVNVHGGFGLGLSPVNWNSGGVKAKNSVLSVGIGVPF